MPSKHTLSALPRRHPGLLVLLGIELVFLVSVFYSALRPLSSFRFTPADLEDWTVNAELTTDGEGRVGIGDAGTAQEETLFSTVALDLPAGFYRITVNYRAEAWFDEKGTLTLPSLSSYTEEKYAVYTYDGSLNPGEESQTFDLCVLRRCSDVRLLLRSNGAVFYLQSLQLDPNRPMMLVLAMGALLLILAADWVVLRVLHGSSLAIAPTAGGAFLGVLGIAFMACIPLFQAGGGMTGHDIAFHLLRIDNMAKSLADGEFPVRIYHQVKSGYGYAPSLYYGELLLYIPAFLRLLGCEMRLVYQGYAAAVTLATAAVTYFCLREMFSRRWLALVGCALYVLSPYRLICVYVRSAVGEYTALLFLPLLALGLWRLYACRKDIPAWGILCVGFGGLLQTHIITMMLSCLVVLCLVLVWWRRTFQPFILLQWVKAAAACIAVNLWFLFPFLTMAGSQLSGEEKSIADEALTLAQLFTRGTTAVFGLALPLGGALLLAVFLLKPAAGGTSYKPALGALGVGAFALFASTRLFPWDAVARIPVLGSLLLSIQFPWRFLGLATLSLTLAALFALQQLGLSGLSRFARAGSAAMLALTAFFCLTFLQERVSAETDFYNGDPSQWMTMSTSSLIYPMDDLYLPEGAVVQGMGYAVNPPLDAAVESIRRDGRTTYVDCTTADREGLVELPLLYYPGYRTDTGTLYLTETGVVGLAVPAGFDGTVTVTWQEPKRWLAADLISLVSIVALAGNTLYRRRQKD